MQQEIIGLKYLKNNLKMNEITVFVERLKKIGIQIELASNVPWIYLDKVNGVRIKPEDWYNANHGYCIAYHGVKLGEGPHLNWHSMDVTFKLIRKYKNLNDHL